jgi:hypothetical protein
MDLATSLASGPHALLARMTGRWAGRGRVWLEDPGAPYCDEPVTGTVDAIHGGRWIRHEYATRIDDAEQTGTALVGFDLSAGVWQAAWVDSWHTSGTIMRFEGPHNGDDELSVLGSYAAGDGPRWGWRTTFAPGRDRLLVRHFNIEPEGAEALAVEFDYTRA